MAAYTITDVGDSISIQDGAGAARLIKKSYITMDVDEPVLSLRSHIREIRDNRYLRLIDFNDVVAPVVVSATDLMNQIQAMIDGAGGGLPDGSYTDIDITGGGTVMTINNGVVSYAKMQDVSSTDRLLGRITAGSGDVEEVVLDTDGTLAADSDDIVATQKAVKTYVDGKKRYVNIVFNSNTFNPVDLGSYYWGGGIGLGHGVGNSTNVNHYSPVTGTIEYVQIRVIITGTLGSNENVTFNLGINGADSAITTTAQLTAATLIYSNTFSIAVTQGSTLMRISIVSPTWATNPTSVRIEADVVIAVT